MSKMKAWRRRMIRRLAPSEGPIVTGWRLAALSLLRPVVAGRYWNSRFRCWACLPGDVFEDFQRDACYVVVRPRPRDVLCAVVPNQLFKHPESYGLAATRLWNGKIILQPATFDHCGIQPVVITETIPRARMGSWWRATDEQRRRARNVVPVP